MEGNHILLEHIASEAADWFARLRESQVAEADHAEFTQWLLRSPDHIKEYMAVARTWDDISLIQGEDVSPQTVTRKALAAPLPNNVVSLEEANIVSATKDPSTQRKPLLSHGSVTRMHRWVATAATTLFASFLIVWLAGDQWRYPSHIQTAIGEQRTVTLADGSTVELNTDSEVRVDFRPHERHLRLLRGEAQFIVAKNQAQPFVVTTDNAQVRAIGTIFNIRKMDKQISVAVFEGRVSVGAAEEGHSAVSNLRRSEGATPEPASSSTSGSESSAVDSAHAAGAAAIELGAGERVAVLAQGAIISNAGPPLERLRSWPDRRLVFRHDTLQVLVAEINRYQEHPLVIGDPSIASIEISGTFSAGDLDSLIEYLKRYRDIRAEANKTGGYTLLRAPR